MQASNDPDVPTRRPPAIAGEMPRHANLELANNRHDRLNPNQRDALKVGGLPTFGDCLYGVACEDLKLDQLLKTGPPASLRSTRLDVRACPLFWRHKTSEHFFRFGV